MGRATRGQQRADGPGNSGASGSSRPEPTRLRLTIGSGPSARALIGARTSDRAPGQAGKWSLRAGPTPTGMLGVGGSDRPKPTRSCSLAGEAASAAAPQEARVWRRCSVERRAAPATNPQRRDEFPSPHSRAYTTTKPARGIA